MIALLLIRPGPLRDGLDALLVSISDVHLIAHPNDAQAALDFCRQNKTELVVFEVRPEEDDLLSIVSEMKSLCAQGNVVALIHSEEERQDVERVDVDLVMTIGTPAPKLKASLEELAHSSMEEFK